MCGNGGKWVKDGVFWPKIDFYSDFGVILVQTTNFTLFCTKSLDSSVVIAFMYNFSWLCRIWGDVGSNPGSGTWFFFFVQINFSMVFMYAYISHNAKNQSKVLGHLLLITLNFWTVWGLLCWWVGRDFF